MTRPHTGRNRNPDTRSAIMSAAAAEVAEHGFAATSIEGIAARARAGKQTIYKWWPSKFHLLLDVVVATANADIPETDHGSLREDLRSFLLATLAQAAGRPLLVALMAQALLDSSFVATLRERLLDQRRQALLRLLGRAVSRGEISEDEDLELLVDVVHGVLWHRLQLQHAPLDADTAVQLADLLTRLSRDRQLAPRTTAMPGPRAAANAASTMSTSSNS